MNWVPKQDLLSLSLSLSPSFQFLIWKCLHFSFPQALKSLPESEPWLLFILCFNINVCRCTLSTFLADELCGRKKWNSFHWGQIPVFKIPHSWFFGLIFPDFFFFFLLMIVFVFCNEHRKIREWWRKVSQDILFFLLLDVPSKEYCFKYLYTFLEHPSTQTNKKSSFVI